MVREGNDRHGALALRRRRTPRLSGLRAVDRFHGDECRSSYQRAYRAVPRADRRPLAKLTSNGEPVRPEAIRRTALLTVEGERDDICAVGQTMAALDLCSGIRIDMKSHHLQSGVGHYGVFSGRRWGREVLPKGRQVIQTTS